MDTLNHIHRTLRPRSSRTPGKETRVLSRH